MVESIHINYLDLFIYVLYQYRVVDISSLGYNVNHHYLGAHIISDLDIQNLHIVSSTLWHSLILGRNKKKVGGPGMFP